MSKFFHTVKAKAEILFTQNAFHESVQFGILLAIVGGFLDAYTFIGRGGVFANAQTGNIVLVGVFASQQEWQRALVHIPPILAFIVGVIVAESIKNNSSQFSSLGWKRAVLILESVILFAVGFIPDSVPNIVVTVTISFVASIQVSSFRKLVDSPYSTTMSTGNLRSASQAAYIAYTRKDVKSAVKSIRFFTIIFSFLLGAFLGGLLTINLGIRAVWGAVIILIIAISLFNIYKPKSAIEL